MFSFREGRIIKSQIVSGRGYLSIKLSGDGKAKKYRIHRLVASAFIPNPENKPEVNHDDFDKTNNFYKNLIWATGKENTNHAQLGGKRLIAKPKVIKIGRNKSYKRVVDTRSGFVYDSLRHLVSITGENWKNLSRRLGGARCNNTPYKYLNDRCRVNHEEQSIAITRYQELRRKIFG